MVDATEARRVARQLSPAGDRLNHGRGRGVADLDVTTIQMSTSGAFVHPAGVRPPS
jgi:hypothetical protein